MMQWAAPACMTQVIMSPAEQPKVVGDTSPAPSFNESTRRALRARDTPERLLRRTFAVAAPEMNFPMTVANLSCSRIVKFLKTEAFLGCGWGGRRFQPKATSSQALSMLELNPGRGVTELCWYLQFPLAKLLGASFVVRRRGFQGATCLVRHCEAGLVYSKSSKISCQLLPRFRRKHERTKGPQSKSLEWTFTRPCAGFACIRAEGIINVF